MPTNENLKPCPFCGSKDIRYAHYLGKVAVSCTDCGSSGEMGDDVYEAARLWNRRAEVKGDA